MHGTARWSLGVDWWISDASRSGSITGTGPRSDSVRFIIMSKRALLITFFFAVVVLIRELSVLRRGTAAVGGAACAS